MSYYNIEVVFRVFLAMVIGGAVGLEREKNHHAAGLRTHMLVCIGACVAMLVGSSFAMTDSVKVDPTRIAAQVVSGVGFLGAGMILRDGRSIKGLTTAAGIWSVACIGLAVGAGFYTVAIVGASAIIIALAVVNGMQKYINKGKQVRLHLEFTTKDSVAAIGELSRLMKEYNHDMKNVRISEKDERGICQVSLSIFATQKDGRVKYSEILTDMAYSRLVESISGEEF